MSVPDHVVFTARDGEWFVAKALEAGDMGNENVAHFLAALSNTVSSRMAGYLGEVMDVEGLMELAKEVEGCDLGDCVAFLKSPKTSRKLGSLIHEKDKKLRKLLVDVARGLLVWEVIEDLSYPERELPGREVKPRFEGRHVDFTAKHGRWIVVKRVLIDEKTKGVDVAYVLAGINDTAVNKLPAYAGIDMEGIEGKLGINMKKKVRKSEIPALVEAYLSLDVSEFAPEEFVPHAKVQALRLLLESIGLPPGVPVKPLKKYVEKAFT
ncbi:MAG: DUF2666 domain-containing protein [Thermococci archaeon]|nr:DUF2666 domain-containing protein [Thermococci archaeon]